MKKLAVIAVACGLALTGCAALPMLSTAASLVSNLTPAAASTSNRVILESSRGLVLAHNAYQGATAVLVPLVNSGRLSREQLLRIRDIDNEAFRLLNSADTGLTEAQRVAKVLNLADELNRMAGR